MLYQIIDFVLFFLVLYFVLPTIMIFAVLIRNFIRQHRAQAEYHKHLAAKPAGW